MNLSDDRRALADRSGDARGRSGANIANREDARQGRLQWQRAFAGYDKALGVGFCATLQPPGVGIRADE